MAVPKRKMSRSSTRSRKSANMRLVPSAHSLCPNCGASKLPHTVCGNCGHYRGRQVLDVDGRALGRDIHHPAARARAMARNIGRLVDVRARTSSAFFHRGGKVLGLARHRRQLSRTALTIYHCAVRKVNGVLPSPLPCGER